jgi:hypothetical protein
MASTRPRPQVAPWLARLTGSLGAFAVGMAGNLVSADIGYRGVVIALAVAAILTATAWLRGFRPDFALVVWVVRGFLALALAAVVVAMVSVTLSGIAVLVAALATLGATLIRSDPADRLALLCGVALIAMGAGMIAGRVRGSSDHRERAVRHDRHGCDAHAVRGGGDGSGPFVRRLRQVHGPDAAGRADPGVHGRRCRRRRRCPVRDQGVGRWRSRLDAAKRDA